jgi:hypothetical protein
MWVLAQYVIFSIKVSVPLQQFTVVIAEMGCHHWKWVPVSPGLHVHLLMIMLQKTWIQTFCLTQQHVSR